MTIKTEKNNHNEKNYNHGETVNGTRRKNSEIWRFPAVNISFIKNLQNIHEKNVTFWGSRALYI